MNAASYPTTYQIHTDAGIALDQMSVYEWIESRVPGGHRSPMGQLLDVAYNIEYGNVSTVQSSLNLIYLLAFQPIPGNFRIFGLSDERYHIVGGNEQLPGKIRDYLPAGTVRTGFSLTAISKNPKESYYRFSRTPGAPVPSPFDRSFWPTPSWVFSPQNSRKAGFSDRKAPWITRP